MRRAMLDQLTAMTQYSAQRNQVCLRAEGIFQQTIAMQGLNPLRVRNIAFSARHTPQRARADQ